MDSFFINETNNLPDYAMTTDVSLSQQSEIEEFELKNALSEIKENKMLLEKNIFSLYYFREKKLAVKGKLKSRLKSSSGN